MRTVIPCYVQLVNMSFICEQVQLGEYGYTTLLQEHSVDGICFGVKFTGCHIWVPLLDLAFYTLAQREAPPGHYRARREARSKA